MRLLYVLHQFLPNHVTGTEQYVRSLALGMQERGHHVEIFAMEPVLTHETEHGTWIESDADVEGIPTRRVGLHIDVQPNRPLADYVNPLAVRLLRRFLDEREFDLAHVFHLRYLGISALNELRVVGLPIVVNLMDFWFLCPNHILLRANGELCDGPPENGLGCLECLDPPRGEQVERLGLQSALRIVPVDIPPPSEHTDSLASEARALVGRRGRLFAALATADVVVAPSRFLRSMFEDNGFAVDVIRHVPYGVDPARFAGHERAFDAAEKRPLEIGYIGSVTAHKGLHVLVPALRAIRGDGWRLNVHGDINTHPQYTEQIRELVDGDERVVFHPRFEPQDLGSVLEGIDLLVVPSLWYENTPFTILEAQMMGVPVLASDLGGMSECVENDKSGFLFKPGNKKDLTSKLRKIISDHTLLEGLEGGAAPRTLSENLDDFESLYEELH